MNKQSLLNKHFDRVSLLSLVDRNDKRGFMFRQNNQLGHLWDPDMLDLHLSVRYPFGKQIAKLFNMSKENEFSVAREHYGIVKQSYELGCESLLIMEDDICLYKDLSAWEACLSAIPEDWDILSFNGFTADKRVLNSLKTYEQISKSKDLWWIERKGIGLWNMGMVALSRRGMEYYLACQDQMFYVADYPIYIAHNNANIVDAYMCSMPMAIQEDKNILSSDVRNAETDSIDYANENMYEHLVNKNDYFKFHEI